VIRRDGIVGTRETRRDCASGAVSSCSTRISVGSRMICLVTCREGHVLAAIGSKTSSWTDSVSY
jgi:hypothetical protein